MTLAPEELKQLRELALKAAKVAPGAWEHDTEPGGGEYGSGPDTRSGYSAFQMLDGQGRRLFGSDGSEVAEIHEEGEDAWDESSRRVFDFLAAANPATILALLDIAESAGRMRDIGQRLLEADALSQSGDDMNAMLEFGKAWDDLRAALASSSTTETEG